MNTLDVVLISTLGFVILCICVWLSVLHLFMRFRISKADEYALYNQISKHKQIVMLGDSITEMYSLQEFFPDKQMYNRGISGNTTREVLTRLDRNVINIMPSQIFIQIGVNDLAKNGDNAITNAYNNTVKIIEHLQNELPDTKIIVVSLFPVNRKKSKTATIFTMQARNNIRISNLNNKLNNYCYTNNITFIDVYTHLLDENKNLRKDFTIEGLHLNFNGYKVVSQVLFPFIYI